MLIITGTYPPRKCGVGDYCQNLLSTQQAKDWNLYTDNNWSISTFFQKIKSIRNTNMCEKCYKNYKYASDAADRAKYYN